MSKQQVSVPAELPFNRWGRWMDGPGLTLIVEDKAGGNPREWREMDVRELPSRPDLLARLGDQARSRLLAEAETATREFQGVPLLVEEVDDEHGDYVFIPVIGEANREH